MICILLSVNTIDEFTFVDHFTLALFYLIGLQDLNYPCRTCFYVNLKTICIIDKCRHVVIIRSVAAYEEWQHTIVVTCTFIDYEIETFVIIIPPSRNEEGVYWNNPVCTKLSPFALFSSFYITFSLSGLSYLPLCKTSPHRLCIIKY